MYRFYLCCVDWPRAQVAELCDMVDKARVITRRTFLRHVDRVALQGLETRLGYDARLRMAADWQVSYHRSSYRGKRVYFFKHSSVEYVFVGG